MLISREPDGELKVFDSFFAEEDLEQQAVENNRKKIRAKVAELVTLMEQLDDRPDALSFAWNLGSPIGLRFDQVLEGVDDYQDLSLMLEAITYVANHFGFAISQAGMWDRIRDSLLGKLPSS